MSPTPRVALVVPAYNSAEHLPRLFETVRAQRDGFDQIIVCDDASTDDTAAVAERLGAHVVRHATNAGCSAAKNTGLAAVTCDWVHFQDADDLLTPEFVAAARCDLATGSVDAWLPRWRHVDATTGAVLGESALDAAALRDDPVGFHLSHTVNNVGAYRAALVRRAGGFDEDATVLHNEDRAFHLRLARSRRAVRRQRGAGRDHAAARRKHVPEQPGALPSVPCGDHASLPRGGTRPPPIRVRIRAVAGRAGAGDARRACGSP